MARVQNTKKNKEEYEKPYQCEFCGRRFSKEKTIINHLCKYKKRWMDQDEKFVKLGFYAYRRFYDICYRTKKEKTYYDFMKSRYYNDFLNVARYILDRGVVNPEKYLEFVIKNSIPLKNWTDDYVYKQYLQYLANREPAEEAVKRTVLLMEQWSRETGNDWREFFTKIETPKAVQMIQSGRISPWILYSTNEGSKLLERFSEEQINMVMEYIDPEFWKKKLKINKNDVEYIRNVLKEAGL